MMNNVYGISKARKIIFFGIILFGMLELGLIRLLFPADYTHELLLIPAYFLFFGVCILLFLKRMSLKKTHPGRAVAQLMYFSLFQMMLTFIVMFCYYYFAEEHKYVMLFAFSAFYLFFMGVKLFIIYNIDIQHKTDKRNAQNAEKED